MQSVIEERANRRAYWLCQLGGWTVLGLYQVGQVVFLAPAHLRSYGAALIEPLLVFTYGLLMTHLLYMYISRRAWLNKLDAKLVVRLGGMILLSAATLNSMEMSSMYFLNQWLEFHLSLTKRVVLLSLGSWVVIMLGWMALYVAIHEVRRRRSQELRALRSELIAQEAQLRGLRAQLNPHFFFNCLNSLREMVHEDPQRAELMVTQLSDLMRYALQSNQADLVALRSEVQAVRDYLALEMIRFEERLRVSWQIADEALDLRIPPMVLQTLVENALKHGIARRPQGGEIRIIAKRQGSEVVLEVLNNGTIQHPGRNGGVGLRNARERLNLLFGLRAELNVQDEGSDCVRATLRLPLERFEVAQ